MKPLFLLVKELEGKLQSGTNGYTADVLPQYNYMALHIEDQLRAFDCEAQIDTKSGVIVRSMAYAVRELPD
jgi:hypothetical protein